MKPDSLRLTHVCHSGVLRVVLFLSFLFFFFSLSQSWPLLTVNTHYLTPVKLQLPLFPGRTNNHHLEYNPKDALRGGETLLLFPLWYCLGLFLTSLLVTLALVRFHHFSSHPSPPLLSICLMAVSMTMGRDTKWLTLEVCREFQRGTCSRSDAECKFAHPSRSCHVENGRVIACFDSLKVTMHHTLYDPSFPSCISCALTHVS